MAIDYRLDGEGRAMFYAEYRATHEEVSQRAIPGKIIPRALGVSFVGNTNLSASHFDLRRSDRAPVGKLIFPGKSAHVEFSSDLERVTRAIFDRYPRRGDHLYTVPAAELIALQFLPFFAPLFNTPLHLRLVYASFIQNPRQLDYPYRAKKALADLVSDYRIA